MQWLNNIKEALSQLINAATGGYPDEMLSARAHRTEASFEILLDSLFGWEHCKRMYEHEFTRKSHHPHYLKQR